MRSINKVLRGEMTDIPMNLSPDFYSKLFSLYVNHQEKPFFTNSQADEKEYVGIMFEEDKQQQYLCVTYFNERRGFAEILMQLTNNNQLSVSNEYNVEKLVRDFKNVLVASYQDDVAYKMIDGDLEPMKQIHSFNNVLDKTNKMKKR